MNLEEILLDLAQRMARVEEKVDAIREDNKDRKSMRLQVYLALLGSTTAVCIALFI